MASLLSGLIIHLQAGHLANVECVAVWCDMEDTFYQEYLGSGSHREQREVPPALVLLVPSALHPCSLSFLSFTRPAAVGCHEPHQVLGHAGAAEGSFG